MNKEKTKEMYNQCCLELIKDDGFQNLGVMSNYVWHSDPKRLVFLLSRYKFVAKMFSGLENVLEVGCSDGFASRIVKQEVASMTGIDIDPVFIKDANKRWNGQKDVRFFVHDIVQEPVEGCFDGIYSLDVIEHISKDQEDHYLSNIKESLSPTGSLIIGTPTLESQEYASQVSKDGHINCKKQKDLKALMSKYFHNVYIFSMNDEVVHTGFYPMANYLMALCCNSK